jgi:hypothetical protein
MKNMQDKNLNFQKINNIWKYEHEIKQTKIMVQDCILN